MKTGLAEHYQRGTSHFAIVHPVESALWNIVGCRGFQISSYNPISEKK